VCVRNLVAVDRQFSDNGAGMSHLRFPGNSGLLSAGGERGGGERGGSVSILNTMNRADLSVRVREFAASISESRIRKILIERVPNMYPRMQA